MTVEQDRRDRGRLPGQVLFIKIGFEPFPLIDISSGGMAFDSDLHKVGDVVSVKIVSVLDEEDFAEAECEVVQVTGSRVATRFVDPSEHLTHFITTYQAQWN